MLHRPKKGDDDESYGGEEDYKKLLDTAKFKADKEFSGASKDKETAAQPRNGPVEFESAEEDPFGLDEFLKEAKSSTNSKGGALDKIGTGGHMNVSNANIAAASEGGSKRGRIDFEGSDGNKNKDSKERRRH